jgi:PIN domain nuclease of toxin-antitoxin system
MELLLDTHTLLWALAEPERLSRTVRRHLEDRSNRLHVSAASAWEISTKQRLGKLPGSDVLREGLDRHLDRLAAHVLDISLDHALLAGRLEWSHRDPFDRMLAAVAMTESLPFVTKDPAFSGVPGVRVIW